MNLSIPGHAPVGESSKLADETLIQNIKVTQAPISLYLGPLNHNIFIRRTKMRIGDTTDLVKFVEANATEDQKQANCCAGETLPKRRSPCRLVPQW